MEEDHHYKVIVVGSNPAVATKLVRNSIGLRVLVFYTGSSGFESLRANYKKIGYRLIGKAPGWRYEFESH